MPNITPAVLSSAPPALTDDNGVVLRVTAFYALAAIVLVLALSLPFATDYVGPDNDDVMRLVMVRDLLAGQGWFDTTQYRLGLAGGTLMHWSRLIDLPIANLVGVFSIVLDQPRAEALALAVWPALLIVPLLYGIGLAAFRLGGRAAMHASLVLTVLLVLAIGRFDPGAIDHHNVQLVVIALLVAMLLDPAMRARDHGIAGVLAGLAIAIGAETTPLVAVVCLALALRWLVRGAVFRAAAAAFGLALASSVTLVFFATVPPSRYGAVTCDSLSYGFYALAVFGGGALFLLAALASRRPFAGRLLALAAAGGVMAAAVLAIAPQCLANPLDTLDPLLKTFWLSGVVEAQSALAQFRIDPGSLGGFYAPGLLALAVCLWRIRRKDRREAHILLFALILVALAIALIQIRGAIFSNLLSVLPLGLMIADLRRAANAEPENSRRGLAFLGLTLASVPAVWAIAGMLLPGPSRVRLETALSGSVRSSCIDPAAVGAIAAEPAGVVAAASNLGAPILRHSVHRVLSAPYHRNQGGMLTELHIGLSEPGRAEAFLRGAGVTLVALCTVDSQVRDIADAEPDGLYATLLKGVVPAYLDPVGMAAGSALRLYRVRPDD
ncbi:hypothetical protein KYK29_17045 [Shinella daejeonensis]|uniref:hypothetical protein n=1 Tax=Shinella daejeonensis TaxID=659017 RepID=UPI0020C7E99B|nr:hypothetical protein [Shinella daejeonensis]MCP8896635.1 hypothetical protein [Shinella daejeonensis]